MKTLAEVDEIFGDPFRDPDNAQGKHHTHMAHVMLYHEYGLMDMIMQNDQNQPREEATRAFLSRVLQGGWYYRMEPAEFLLNYFSNWFSLDEQVVANRRRMGLEPAAQAD